MSRDPKREAFDVSSLNNNLDFWPEIGHNIARMKHRIVFAPEARDDYESLRAFQRAEVRDAIRKHLVYQPERRSKSRIKRLRDMKKPQYRLRVGNIRVFYDVRGSEVEVIAIVDKACATEWLERQGGES